MQLLQLHDYIGISRRPVKAPAEEINKPRPDARKITFEVTEGIWLSVDVSADGNSILFDLLGDIYSMPATGGEAKRLTSGPACVVRTIARARRAAEKGDEARDASSLPAGCRRSMGSVRGCDSCGRREGATHNS